MLVSVAYVMTTPFLRVGLYYFLCRHPCPWVVDLGKLTPVRLDSIAIGCCLALLVASPRFATYLRLSPKTSRWLFAIGIGLLVGLTTVSHTLSQFKPVEYYTRFLSYSVLPVLMAVLIWSAANFQGGLVSFLLNSRPFQAIGILSYSLYLWQQIFLTPYRSGWAFSWPVNVALAFLAAGASYLCIESPFLRLKERLGHSFRMERRKGITCPVPFYPSLPRRQAEDRSNLESNPLGVA